MRYKICAVIIVYNPKLTTLNNLINSIINFVDNVVICNNSDYPLNLASINSEFVELNFNENLGLGEAQNRGIEFAFENFDSEYILNLDQDSLFIEQLVSEMFIDIVNFNSSELNVGLVGPSVLNTSENTVEKPLFTKGERFNNSSYFSVPCTLSSGSIIWRKAFQRVNGHSPKLFIDYVDFDFCWRLRQNGFEVLVNRNIHMPHQLGNGKKNFCSFPITIHQPFRNYYQNRNFIYLLSKKYVPFRWKITKGIKLFLRNFIYLFITKDYFVRYKYTLLGIRDGFKMIKSE